MTKKSKTLAALLAAGIIFTGGFYIHKLSDKNAELEVALSNQLELNQEKDISIEDLNNRLKTMEDNLHERNQKIEELQESIKQQESTKQANNTMEVELTFYGATGELTASGTVPQVGRTVACNFLPMGTHVRINGHEYIVEDTGAMQGNVIDVFVHTEEEATQLGRQSATMEILLVLTN